ncbi:MAG: response regulator [Candidatus Omnitrophica bacterium]|jgi:CheY-like chemotaxis protein|nr:response regulator [Candidatus Omnitrophota bacterium]
MEKKKILVIDDEPDFLKLFQIRLEANNFSVATALSGKEGLEKIKNDRPDAVFLDILMPEMDGLEVLRIIREHDAELPVFMITVFSAVDKFDQERFKAARGLNATGFIFKTKDLDREIKNVITLLEGIKDGKKKNSIG